jgi:hypothetical protein
MAYLLKTIAKLQTKSFTLPSFTVVNTAFLVDKLLVINRISPSIPAKPIYIFGCKRSNVAGFLFLRAL